MGEASMNRAWMVIRYEATSDKGISATSAQRTVFFIVWFRGFFIVRARRRLTAFSSTTAEAGALAARAKVVEQPA